MMLRMLFLGICLALAHSARAQSARGLTEVKVGLSQMYRLPGLDRVQGASPGQSDC